MVTLHAHEAGNGGQRQGNPTAATGLSYSEPHAIHDAAMPFGVKKFAPESVLTASDVEVPPESEPIGELVFSAL